MKKPLTLFIFVFFATIVLAACAAGPKSVELQITMKEYEFSPSRFEIPASAEVTLTLINDGTLEHEIVFMNLGKTVSLPFSDDDEPNIFWEHELAPATSEVVAFTAPGQAGEYQTVCGIEEHLEKGMAATLIVK